MKKGVYTFVMNKGDVHMNNDHREKIIVAVAAILFFAAFGAIAMMDQSHGTDGEGIDAQEVNIDITQNEGHLSIPSVPGDLLVLGAGSDATVDLRVENNDRDNDIDTIKVLIPGGVVIDGTSTWYNINALDHEWTFNATATDEATFEAQDDILGRIFGGSAQYDVVGNVDDALDHFSENATIPVSVNEAITVTVEFTAPTTSGILTGNDGMMVSVGDLKTEDTPDTMTDLYPDGYTYIVVEDGYSFIVITVDSDEITLEVQYGTKTLFQTAATRGTNHVYADEGFRYNTDGKTIAVLEAPASEDVVIKPVIKALEGSTVENVEVNMQLINVKDITATGTDLYEVIEENSAIVSVPDVDSDGDWIFDSDDPDDDNDDIPDERDPYPLIPGTEWINDAPTINTLTGPEENKVEMGNAYTLTVNAEDVNSDPITITWTLSGSSWTETGASVSGPIDLEKGDYTFTVTVEDDKGGLTNQTIDVEIFEEEVSTNNWFIIIAIGAVLLIIVVVVVFFLMKGKGDDEDDEAPEEIPAEEPTGGYREPEPGYETEDPGYQGEEVMDEEVYVEAPMAPPEPMEEPVADVSVPSMGTVPSIEEEGSGEMPTLPGDVDDSAEIQDLESLIDEMERGDEDVGDACPECNSPLGPYDSECPNCGAQFEVALECPNCGAVVEDNVADCPSCGVSFM